MSEPRYFAVIPAAGRSRRMGSPKLLLPWRGGLVIDHLLAQYQASQVTGYVLTAHPDDHELIAAAGAGGAITIADSPPPRDMKESVQRGLKRIAALWNPQPHDAWLLAPADMPLLTSNVIDALIAADQGGEVMVPTRGEKRGHPVLFRWPLHAEVFNLPDDQGVNALLRDRTVQTVAIDDDGAYRDLDTLEAYSKILEQE